MTRRSWLGALLVAAACNSPRTLDGGVDAGGATDGGTGDAGVVALADYTRRVSEAFCAKVFECCSTGEVARVFNDAFADRASCVETFVADFDRQRPMLEASIDAGRVRYEPAAAGACVSGFADLACAGFNRWFGPPACKAGVFSVFTGLVPDGGVCDIAADCGGPNAVCGPMEDGGQACIGGSAVGEPCGNPAACLPGAHCFGGSSGVPPPPPVCAPMLAVGEPCLVQVQCESHTCGQDGSCHPTQPLCTGR